MRVLFVASEGLPYSKTGGLADVIEALPKALVAQGHEVAVLLPFYRGTPGKIAVLRNVTLPMGTSPRPAAILDGGDVSGVRYFFLDDPKYFDRDQLYGAGGADYPDNAERYAALSYAAIELSRRIWTPDVVHCHDWQTALVPVLIRTRYESGLQLARLPVIFTVHNMGYQGVFPREVLASIGAPDAVFGVDGLEFYGQVSYLKGGLLFADYLTTVSRKYAEEIQTAEYGHGLEGVAHLRADRLVGILNGADYSVWNPEIDPLIAARYSAENLAGKQICKSDLLKQFPSFEGNLECPLVGIVSRFADQKGFDLLAEVGDALLDQDLAFAVLGTGEVKYQQMFKEWAKRYPAKLAVKIGYDNTLAHKIEAGADMFLMPSRYEPCGLNQIYGLRYGTVPVVRATGGLDDTIEAYDPSTGRGDEKATGFKFSEYTGEALLAAVRQAVAIFDDKAAWRRIQMNGMAKDFSWEASASEYARLYEAARKERIRSEVGTSNISAARLSGNS